MATSSAHCIIECSDQPLDISFHPRRPCMIAAGLVDGTLEVHDFEEMLLQEQGGGTSLAAASLTAASFHDNNNDDDDHDHDDEIDTIVSSTAVHTQMIACQNSESGMKRAACRAVQFSLDGHVLYTGGSEGGLVGLDACRITTFTTEKKKPIQWRCKNAAYGSAGIQVIHEFRQQIDSNNNNNNNNNNSITLVDAEEPLQNQFRTILATGDEVGGVRIWDTRLLSQRQEEENRAQSNALKRPFGCVHSWKVHEDYISGFANSQDGYTLLASSADCTISAYDLRMARQQNQPQDKIVRRSDDQEDELLSIQLMKHGRKVICGSGEGVLSIFSWGTWGDVSDRFPGHPASVDALLPFDEDTLLTGSSDGLIRVCSIHPNKLLGILGDHEGFPIEKLRMNSDRKYVASVTHDDKIRIWDTSILNDDCDHEMDHDVEGLEEHLVQVNGSPPVLNGKKPAGALKSEEADNSDGEWEDMDEEMVDDDTDDDNDDDVDSNDDHDDGDGDTDEEIDEKNNSKPQSKHERRKNRLKTEREKFFQDL